jgi:hypothetical protein
MKKLLVGLLVLGSLTAHASSGDRTITKAIKCARTILFNHQGSKIELVEIVGMLKKVQVYLSTENASQTVSFGPIQNDLAQCEILKNERIKGYGTQDIANELPNDARPMAEKLFTLIDQDIKMSFQLRKIVKNLVERNDSYRGINELSTLKSLLSVDPGLEF